MKRSPMKPAKGKVWKRLKPVSKKMSLGLAKYSKIRKEYLKLHDRCQLCDCSRATSIHHAKGRTGPLLCDTKFFYAVCDSCHEKIHKNPAWSRENGYSLDRLGYRSSQASYYNYE